MDDKSYFTGEICDNRELSKIKIFPLNTSLLLTVLGDDMVLIKNLYVEIGDTTIKKPCDVLTEANFSEICTAKELKSELEKGSNYFIMNLELEHMRSKFKFIIEDDIETQIVFPSGNRFFERIFSMILDEFSFRNRLNIIDLIKENPEKIICLNEDGTLWKIFENEQLFLDDSEAMKLY